MARPQNTTPYQNKDGSWAVRVRIFDEEKKKTEYTTRSGFKNEEEAQRARKEYEKVYEQAKKAADKRLDGNMVLSEYMPNWCEGNVYPRIDIANSTKMLADYTTYELISPVLKKHGENNIPIRLLSTERIDDILDKVCKSGTSTKASSARFYLRKR